MQVLNDVFAYETDGEGSSIALHIYHYSCAFSGFGARYVMDDANVPVRSIFCLMKGTPSDLNFSHYCPCRTLAS